MTSQGTVPPTTETQIGHRWMLCECCSSALAKDRTGGDLDGFPTLLCLVWLSDPAARSNSIC